MVANGLMAAQLRQLPARKVNKIQIRNRVENKAG